MKQISLKMVDKTNFLPYKNITVKDVNYQFGHQIAKGHFSTLYDAKDIWNNNLVVKVYTNDMDEKIVDNEISQLKRFASPLVVSLYEAFKYDEYHFLIIEKFGVAISRIKTKDFDTKVRIFFECARSLLQTLHNIHQAGYIHGDINPQNLLIEIKDNQLLGVKLCDFSFCRKHNSPNKDYMAVANWILPPEYFEKGVENLSSSLDIYHASLVLYSILYDGKLDYTEDEILKNKPQIDVLNSNTPIIKALSSALDINPSKRPSALQMWKNILKSKG